MKKILGLVLSLTLISGICAGVLAYVDAITKEPIAQMKVAQAEAAAKAVMPAGVSTVTQTAGVYIGLNDAGQVVGYALEGKDAGGYGGDIILMVGFETDKETVVCYQKLQASETPGLGTKLTSPEFANQFFGKNGTALAVTKDGGQIEAITAATITSRAVCRAIADAAAKLKALP